MTGELFNLLKKHSILADLLATAVTVDEDFERGVRRGLDGDDLLAELFSIRARVLLGKAQANGAASFASGLLIGSDLRLGLRGANEEEIVVMGRPELTGLFAAAIAIAGRQAREVDGEEAFLAGARQLAELVQ
jgi:2-dehydro-3-deoxygalactonokinase